MHPQDVKDNDWCVVDIVDQHQASQKGQTNLISDKLFLFFHDHLSQKEKNKKLWKNETVKMVQNLVSYVKIYKPCYGKKGSRCISVMHGTRQAIL